MTPVQSCEMVELLGHCYPAEVVALFAIAVVSIALGEVHSLAAPRLCWLAERLEPDDETTPIDDVHQQYLDGEIDEHDLERRLAVLVDDRATTIRDMTDDVEGIGEELSRDLAREFDSVADLTAADSEELQAVDGIGETRAERLREEL